MNPAMMNKMRKLQRELQEAQAKLDASVFTGSAGGGMVKVEAYGTKQIIKITVDEDALNKEDKEMLEDTLVAAVNDVLNKIEDETKAMMGPLAGGLGF